MFYLCFNKEEKKIVEITDGKAKPTIMGLGGIWTRVGYGYKTLEELYAGERILDEPCVVCGQLIESHYLNRQELVDKNMCFSCNIWDTRFNMLTQPNIMIVDGYFYSIASEDQSNPFRGFGGRKFVFERLDDGKIIESTNVWGGGDIPAIWRDKLPDNAKIHLKW